MCRRHPSLLDGLADIYRTEIDRVLAGDLAGWSGESGHQRLFVACAELVHLAAGTRGLLLTIDDLHEADDATLRLLHYLARSTVDQRVAIVASYRDRPHSAALGPHAGQPARPPRRHRARAPTARPGRDRRARRHPRRPSRRRPDRPHRRPQRWPALRRGGAGPSHRGRARLGAVRGRPHDRRRRAGHPRRAAARRRGRVPVRHRPVRRPVRAGRERRLRPPRRRGRRRRRRGRRRRVPVPTRAGPRRAAPRPPTAPAPADPPRRRRAAGRARCLTGADRPPPPRSGRCRRAPPATCCRRRRARRRSAPTATPSTCSSRSAPMSERRIASRLLALRADLLLAVGDPTAVGAYRDALDGAPTGRRSRTSGPGSPGRRSWPATSPPPRRRSRASRSRAVPTTPRSCSPRPTSPSSPPIWTTAWAITEEAQRRVLAGERSWQVLDLVSLQGLLAHHRGEWFDRMRAELRRTRDAPEIANAVFDGYLCAAEYLLYGPTPYGEVIELAGRMRATAERSGALRAAAFATALIGESALLAGDLDLAERELGDAVALHHDLDSTVGEAHSLQRLAEVHLARGDRETARALLHRALPLARWSILAMHLLQRIYGTLIAAAPDRDDGARRGRPRRGCARTRGLVPVLLDHARPAGRHRLRAERRRRPCPAPPAHRRAIGHALGGDGVAGLVRRGRRPRRPRRRRPGRRRPALRRRGGLFQRADQPRDAERCRRLAAETS